VTLRTTVTPRQVGEAVGRFGHSRYVLVDDDGNMRGYLHYKDVIAVSGEALDRAVPARSIRRMATVAADAEAEDVLSRMRQTGAHLATVEDSSGAVLGVLFLEDIVEELIGEVHDASGRA
ncbi:MAG TPA: CBS domain-containing protein, partial [Trueperaceae bacterium]|nr:CBS domain-containing protein [Trueperaceae bacterium]